LIISIVKINEGNKNHNAETEADDADGDFFPQPDKIHADFHSSESGTMADGEAGEDNEAEYDNNNSNADGEEGDDNVSEETNAPAHSSRKIQKQHNRHMQKVVAADAEENGQDNDNDNDNGNDEISLAEGRAEEGDANANDGTDDDAENKAAGGESADTKVHQTGTTELTRDDISMDVGRP
jgi:hypothetical protein